MTIHHTFTWHCQSVIITECDDPQVINRKYNHYQSLLIIYFSFTKVNFTLIYQSLKILITSTNKKLTCAEWVIKLCVMQQTSLLLIIFPCHSPHCQSSYCFSPHCLCLTFVSLLLRQTFSLWTLEVPQSLLRCAPEVQATIIGSLFPGGFIYLH